MPAPYSGGCQCGAIRYEITDEPTVVYACHCTECQTQSGSAFGMTVVVPSGQFKLLKGAPKVFSRIGESGRTMKCLFCANCGTRIYHEPSGIAENKNIKPGTLDDTSWVVPTVHVWLKSAQSWVQIPDETLNFEEQPKDRSWLKRK